MYQIGLPLLGIVIAVAVVLYRLNLLPWMRHSSSTWTANKTSAAAAVNRNPYPAVSIRCAGGCEAVQAFKKTVRHPTVTAATPITWIAAPATWTAVG